MCLLLTVVHGTDVYVCEPRFLFKGVCICVSEEVFPLCMGSSQSMTQLTVVRHTVLNILWCRVTPIVVLSVEYASPILTALFL